MRPGGEQKIDAGTGRVHRPIQVVHLPFYADVSFIDTPALVAQVPTHGHENQLRLKLPPFELHRPWFGHLTTYQDWMRQSWKTASRTGIPWLKSGLTSNLLAFKT